MQHQTLCTTRPPLTPALEVLPGIALRTGRVHEACGPARRVLAAWAIAATQRAGPSGGAWGGAAGGPPPATMWIRPAWISDRINPHGLAVWADPGALVVVDCPRAPDLLWCAEEALRAGSAALVVIDLPEPPGLTPVRRLHLAAEAGAARAHHLPAGQDRRRPQAPAPLGVLLTPGDGGAAGVESRWRLEALSGAATISAPPLAPAPSTRPTDTRPLLSGHWQLDRLRARRAPPARWRVDADAASCLTLAPLPP